MYYLLYTLLFNLGVDYVKKCRQLREAVLVGSEFSPKSLFDLLIDTAQIEFIIKEVSEIGYYL